jgi:anti-sigma factor RsiW
MDCRTVQERIADFSVGLLRAREATRVQTHLDACPQCAREWRQLEGVMGLVERFGAREPPPHLWNGVYNRITAEAAHQTPGFWERLLGAPRRLLAGTATGLAAAALVAAFYLIQPPPAGNHDGPMGTQTAVLMQQHAMLAGAEPFADEVGLEAYARLVNNPTVNQRLVR